MSGWLRKPATLEGLDLTRGVVVEASAGTGKTYFLEHLVAELVLERGAAMREIVLVTFTEKAAGELRARVRRILSAIVGGRRDERAPGDVGWTIDDERLARARRALLELPEAFVGTLHQLCLEALRDVDPAFAAGVHITEEPLDEAWRHVIRQAVLDDDLGEAWARLPRVTRDQIKDAACELVRVRAPHRPTLTELEDGVHELVRLWRSTGAPLPGDEKHPYTDDRMFRQHASGGPADAYRGWVAHLVTSLDAFTRREGAEWGSFLLSLLPAWPLREAANKWPDKAASDAKVCPDERVRRFFKLGGYLTRHARSYVVATLGARLGEQLRELHEQRGTLSFDEMVARFRDALAREAGGEERPIARDLRRRFRYVLVDEFQDTDDVQWEALRRAFLAPCAHPASTVVVVGDPKQAIYRFRGADVEAYRKAKELLLEGGEPTRLVESYRSSPDVIAALNALLPGRLFRAGDGIEVPPISARAKTRFVLPAGERAVTLLGAPPLDAPPVGGNRYNKAALERLFARAIAQQVEALLADPEPRFTDPKGGGPRRLVAGDLCVLGRGKADLDVVGRALRRRGIPFVHYKRRGLYQTAEALDLLDVLLAALEPSPANHMRALATVFFPIAAPELVDFADLDDEHPYRRALAEWREHARAGDVPALLRSLESRVPVMERLLFHEGERAATNLRQLLDELLALHAREGFQLPHLVDELRRRIADDAAKNEAVETDLLQVESERSLVTLMTMHAAKGLEYPVVFLAGGYRGGNRSAPKGMPVVLHEGDDTIVALDPRDFAEQWRSEEDAEDARLLYVALTRAQALLFLPWWKNDDVTRVVPGLYARLKPRLDELAQAGGDEHIGHREVTPPPSERPRVPGEVSDDTLALVRAWRPSRPAPHALRPDEERRLRAARAPVVVDSFSSLKRELEARMPSEAEETDRPGPEGHERHEVDPAPPVEESELSVTFPGGRVVGDVVHQLLERVDRRRVASLPNASALLEVEAAAFERLRRIGLDEDAQRGVAEAVFAGLRSPLQGDVRYPPVSEIVEQLVEEEFLLPHVVARGGGERGYLTGSIDLVFRHEGRTCLADWKTNVLRTRGRLDYSPARVAEETWSEYALQLKLYTVALLRWLAIDDEETYAERFGGVFYLYLRGMRADGDGRDGVFFHRPSFAEARGYVDEIARVATGEAPASKRAAEEVLA